MTASGGAIYSDATNSINILRNINCTFSLNSAKIFGGAIRAWARILYFSENSVYKDNTAATGSVISEADWDADFVMKNDTIYNNIATTATIHVSKPIYISIEDTLFENNTALNHASGIYIEESVINFTCYKCVFRENTAKSGGVLTILKAENFALMSSKVLSNSAHIGHMVEIKNTFNCSIKSTLFKNNMCENEPCHLAIDSSTWSLIKDSTFIHDVGNPSVISDESDAINIKTQNLFLQNFHISMDVGGYALQILDNEGSYFENLSSICPFHHTSLTTHSDMSYIGNNSFDGNASIHFDLHLQFSGNILNRFYYTKGAFKVKCIPCERNEYRMGISKYSLGKFSKQSVPINADVCYKCPPGGHCKDHHVQAEPNYWGMTYKNKIDFVICPEGYCCQSSPCVSYDACSEGRTGQLCASCKDGYRLSMLSEECLLIGQCEVAWVSVAIISSGCVYIAFLFVKVEIANILSFMKQKVQKHSKRNRQAGKNYKLEALAIQNSHEPEKIPDAFMEPDLTQRNQIRCMAISGPINSHFNG